MSNGLACDVSMSTRFLLGNRPVEQTGTSVSRPLGSPPTPASRRFPATTGRSVSEPPRRYSVPSVAASARSLSRPVDRHVACRPAGSVGARLLMFRARAADQTHAVSTPGTAWPVHGHLPSSSRGSSCPPVLMPSPRLRRLNDDTRYQALWNVFLVPT